MPESAGQAKPPLFRAVNLSRRWRHFEALRCVSLEVAPREVVLLAGPSGAGKSTLLRLLVGGLRPTGGHVEVDGVDLGTMSARELRKYQARCGLVEQGSLLVPQLNVHQNILAGQLARWPWYRILLSAVWPLEEARVRELLEKVGLADRQWEVTSVLSGGEQQRVAILRGLISSASIILADEPIAALDAANAARMTQLILGSARQVGGTVIFCTHRVGLVLPFVDRFLGIREGVVAVDCPANQVRDGALDELYKGSLERM